MASIDTNSDYRIWGVDQVVYGPVELPTLVQWVKDERVTAGTWVYSAAKDAWQRAEQLPELQMFFHKARTAAPGVDSGTSPASGLKPGALRRVKIFADMSDPQLETLARFIEVQNVRQWTEIVKQGEPGEAMYLVLEGEVRVRLMIGGKETTLATLAAGELFGEIALFDSGPRSADIVANRDSALLKITAANFRQLATEFPSLATPMLLAIGKTLTARIRADNKRYRDSVSFARAAGPPAPARAVQG